MHAYLRVTYDHLLISWIWLLNWNIFYFVVQVLFCHHHEYEWFSSLNNLSIAFLNVAPTHPIDDTAKKKFISN